MPLDAARVRAARIPDTDASWDSDDVILYHLGLGAGADPVSQTELEYVYEPVLKVLPSFASVPMFASMAAALSIDGLEVNPLMILHGEHEVSLNGPIPTEAGVTNRARVVGVHDKEKGALVRLAIDSVDASGTTLFTNTAGLFLRGEGGFEGDPDPAVTLPVPEREPDLTVESPTLPQQALIYRMSGDRNPLHADPTVAAFAGYERPILHGLCSFGIVCKAVVDGALAGDVTAARRFSARFSGPVFPGETIVTRAWHAPEGWIVEADVAERGTPVLRRAVLEVAAG